MRLSALPPFCKFCPCGRELKSWGRVFSHISAPPQRKTNIVRRILVICLGRKKIEINLNCLLSQGSLARKKFARKFFKYVYLSLFIITKLFFMSESLLLFKLYQLMVHESSLKIFLAKLFLARYVPVPCLLPIDICFVVEEYPCLLIFHQQNITSIFHNYYHYLELDV